MIITAYHTRLVYACIAVVDLAVGSLNEWTEQYDAQGFAWRPGSVTFAMPEDYDDVLVEILRDEPLKDDSSIVRSILVPFDVSPHGEVEITDFLTGTIINLDPGQYNLRFEAGKLPFNESDSNSQYAAWCRLTFNRGRISTARLLVVDDKLKPTYPLLMNAKPA